MRSRSKALITSLVALWTFLSSSTIHAADETDKKFELDVSANQGVKAYTRPGVVSFRAGRWIGSDNLYNLTGDIRVIAEIIKPAGTTITLTAETIRSKAEEQLKKGSINPVPPTDDTKGILPFLHVQILLYPIEGGFAVGIDARLMENVTLQRVTMEAGAAWQAVTWEKQTLIITSAADVATNVQQAVDNALDSFVKRYQFYQKLKNLNK